MGYAAAESAQGDDCNEQGNPRPRGPYSEAPRETTLGPPV